MYFDHMSFPDLTKKSNPTSTWVAIKKSAGSAEDVLNAITVLQDAGFDIEKVVAAITVLYDNGYKIIK